MSPGTSKQGRAAGEASFTLIELLVVVAIIALLLSILMPALAKGRELARRSVCAGHLRQLMLGVQQYAGDYNSWAPPGSFSKPHGPSAAAFNWGPDSGYPLIWTLTTFWAWNGPWGEGRVGLGFLCRKYVAADEMYFCASGLTYDPFNTQRRSLALMRYFGDLSHRPPIIIYGGYFYRMGHRMEEPDISTKAAIADSGFMTNTVPRSPFWPLNHPDGYNAAFFDGHVSWHPDPEQRWFEALNLTGDGGGDVGPFWRWVEQSQ